MSGQFSDNTGGQAVLYSSDTPAENTLIAKGLMQGIRSTKLINFLHIHCSVLLQVVFNFVCLKMKKFIFMAVVKHWFSKIFLVI